MSFINNGFFIYKNCINKDLIKELKKSFLADLKEITKIKTDNINSIDKLFLKAINAHHQFDVQSYLHHGLQHRGLKERVLKETKILNFCKKILGSDLAYNEDGSLVANVKPTKDNLYQKNLHQEMWSGAGLNELRCWFPIITNKDAGGMFIIPGSHLWGFIENRDRKPYNLPADLKFRKIDIRLKETDALFFHGLTLHETEPNFSKKIRFACTVGIKNFSRDLEGHQHLQNWKIYNYSTMSIIQKRLGNPFLSQFRTANSPLSHKDLVKKKEIKKYFT